MPDSFTIIKAERNRGVVSFFCLIVRRLSGQECHLILTEERAVLSPGNVINNKYTISKVIMIDINGRLKLIDFGIARHYSRNKVKDTYFMGTPGFSPPEQYGRGQSDPF